MHNKERDPHTEWFATAATCAMVALFLGPVTTFGTANFGQITA
jgi:hypothetical protein